MNEGFYLTMWLVLKNRQISNVIKHLKQNCTMSKRGRKNPHFRVPPLLNIKIMCVKVKFNKHLYKNVNMIL